MRLTVQDYRAELLADAARLRAAAAATPQAPVPTCPGWVARDIVDHVGEVYAHKVAVLRLARRPEEGEWPWAPDDDGVFSWYDDRLAELVGELDARDPAAVAWTFVDADQTVGFWWRRMAHETAIHRVDAELAAGRELTPHDMVLAHDGVDELLGFAAQPSVLADARAAQGRSGTVRVVAGDRRWIVSMTDDAQLLGAASADVSADARVEGAPGDVYRSLWNRPAAGDVTREGDPTVLQRFEARLTLGMT